MKWRETITRKVSPRGAFLVFFGVKKEQD